MSHTERTATERKLDRLVDDVRRAKLVEDGLLQSNSEAHEYVFFLVNCLDRYSCAHFREVKNIRQTQVLCSHISPSLNSFKGNMIPFWPEHQRYPRVTVPTHAVKNRTNPNKTELPSPRIRKWCTPSHQARHILRGSCHPRRENRPRNQLKPRPSRGRKVVITGRGLNNPLGGWVSFSMVRTQAGVVLTIRLQLQPWDPSRTPPAVISIS